jgi:phospholipid N-methyltransferase
MHGTTVGVGVVLHGDARQRDCASRKFRLLRAASGEPRVRGLGSYLKDEVFEMSSSQTGHAVSHKQQIPSRTRRGHALLFARNFFRHPRMLGSIVPSSRFLIKQLLEPIDWARAQVIVEYGPGVGNITQEILRRMRPDACLIAIETNPDFVRLLRSSTEDGRLHVVEASAESVVEILRQHGHEKASYIISGIPFSTIAAPLRERILRKTCSVLEPRGSFLVYQFSTRVLQDLQRIFRYVARQFEPLNVLPAYLFFCRPDGVTPAASFALQPTSTAPTPPPIRSGSGYGSRQ